MVLSNLLNLTLQIKAHLNVILVVHGYRVSFYDGKSCPNSTRELGSRQSLEL